MALVKFYSKAECQLFIDMEYVGILKSDTLLKLSLDVGSYLVDIRNMDGDSLKLFELQVNSTDSQILQNIDECLNTGLDDVIEKLKMDSSIRFYNHRAIFCYNNKYGYIDSHYEVVIPPEYSFAEKFITNKALVKKSFPDGEKATIIDIEGNICLEKWYDYIGSDSKAILLKEDDKFYVLSRDKNSIVREFFDADYNGKGCLIPVWQNDNVDKMYGYIDKLGNVIIPFIYDYAWNFEDNGIAKVNRFGNEYYINQEGTLYKYMEDALLDTLPNDDKRVKEIYHKLTKKESLEKSFDTFLPGPYHEWNYYPIKENGYWGLGGYDEIGHFDDDGDLIDIDYLPTNKIELYKCDRFLLINEKFIIYRINGILKVLYTERPDIILSFIADEAIPIIISKYNSFHDSIIEKVNRFIVRKGSKYGIVNLKGETVLPVIYDAISPIQIEIEERKGEIGIIWKDGKCSFVQFSDGRILTPFKYEGIIVNDADSTSKCKFI